MKRVLLVGLGRMGLPIARHLIEHGFEVHSLPGAKASRVGISSGIRVVLQRGAG